MTDRGAIEGEARNISAEGVFILFDALNFFWRMKLTVDRDNDFDSRDAKYGAVMRFSTFWEKGWQGVYGSPGA